MSIVNSDRASPPEAPLKPVATPRIVAGLIVWPLPGVSLTLIVSRPEAAVASSASETIRTYRSVWPAANVPAGAAAMN